MKNYGIVEFKLKQYELLEEARDIVDSSGFHFEAFAIDEDCNKYIVYWDCDNPEAWELCDNVRDWNKPTNVEPYEFDWESVISLDEAIDEALEAGLDIHSRSDMLEYAKYCIDEDRLFLAIHVLEGVNDRYEEYYIYDYTMGTLEEPVPIIEIQDIVDKYGFDFLFES